MTTIKSSSEKSRFASIYRSALKSQTAFAIINTIVMSMLIPLVYFMNTGLPSHMGLADKAAITAYFERNNFFSNGIYVAQSHAFFVTCILMLLTLVIALVQNAYLHSKKMTDLYHSLPVRRPTLMGANMLASMTVILGPYLLIVLITTVLQLILYGQYIPDMGRYFAYIGIDIFGSLVTVACIYAFTTFVAVNVGTVFDTFALTGVIGITPIALLGVCLAIWSALTYGASAGMSWVFAISPLTFGMQRFIWWSSYAAAKDYTDQVTRILTLNGIWAVLTCVIFIGAVVCYNRRKSESAEQTQPAGVLQTIAKCVGGFLGGALFFAIFYNTGSMVSWVLAIVAGAVLVGLIAELILSRGVHSVKKNFKWLLCAAGFCLLVLVASQYDLIGYTTKVPAADQVASVTLNYRGRFERLSEQDHSGLDEYGYMTFNSYNTRLTDPAAIGVVVDAHSKAVADQPPYDFEQEDDATYRRYPHQWIILNYEMKDGSTQSRSYSRMNLDALLALTGLEGEENFVRQNHMLFYGDNNTTAYTEVRGATLYDSLGGDTTPLKLADGDRQRLLDAARQDMLAETAEDVKNPTAPPLGYLDLTYTLRQDYDYSASYYCRVVINETYTNTLAVLEDLGLDGLLGMPETQPDEVLLLPMSYLSGANIVVSYQPDYGGTFRPYPTYDDYEEYYVVMDDTATIQSVMNSIRGQMLVLEEGPLSCNAVQAVFYTDGQQVGGGLVAWDDLPEAAREQLLQWYETEEGGILIPMAEEVMSEVTVELSEPEPEADEETDDIPVESTVER